MSTNPLGSPKFRAFDSNGNPLSGGKLYAYSAGTTTPLDTYTTRDGSVANANPVVLDANGEANVWMSPGVLYKFVLKTSADVTQWTVDNFPSAASTDASSDVVVTEPGGRLTLTSLTPVTTADVTGATTIYYSPYKHSKVPLYDGSAWALFSIGAELSQATTDSTKSPAAVAVSSNYDLFVWSDSGTIRLSRGPVWTSATARGAGAGTTELERVNGRYVNKVSIANGPGAQRGLYVGTIRSDASSQINDSMAKRHVWNNHNKVPRPMRVTESTDTWNYTTATIRQANGSAANQLDFVRGVDEDAVSAEVVASVTNAATTNVAAGIGLDSTTAFATGAISRGVFVPADTHFTTIGGSWTGLPGLGRHFLAWLEWSSAVGTSSWGGDAGGAGGVYSQSGIYGTMLA